MITIQGSLCNLSQEEISKIEELMHKQNSAKRIVFKDLQKGLSWKDGLKRAQELIKDIPQRYLHSAKDLAKALYSKVEDQKVIFGGKKNFGKVSNKEWKELRNNSLYSEGWKEKKGNLNLRIENDKLRIAIGDRKFLRCNLFIPEKYKDILEQHLLGEPKYTVNIKRSKNKKRGTNFIVNISFEVEKAPIITNAFKGVIGIDINPTLISIVETDENGKFTNIKDIDINEGLSKNSNARLNYLSNKIEEVCNYCLKTGKDLVFEDLKFKNDKAKGKKLNRIFSQFTYKKIINLLISKCHKKGINFIQVNPAFTSKIGKLKYSQQLCLSSHQSAAYVIARRGLGFKEKIPKLFKQSLSTQNLWKKDEMVSNWKVWSILFKLYLKLLKEQKIKQANFTSYLKEVLDQESKIEKDIEIFFAQEPTRKT